jgi:hypothetical protein
MRYAYAVTQAETFSAVVRDAQPLIAALTAYSQWLETLGAVDEPRGIVFHDLTSATTVFSTLVLPAWTDLTLIHLDPVLDDWKQIFLSALASGMPRATQVLVEDYYQTLETVDIATIAAHELTHHLHCFSDTPQQATWFEEGFCFYAPRKHLLSPARLTQLQQVEQALIEVHAPRLGGHPIWQLGLTNTGGSFTDALFDYWRAIHTVSHLGQTYAHGDVKHLLTLFEQWKSQQVHTSRLDAFLIETLGVSKDDQEALWLLEGASPG